MAVRVSKVGYWSGLGAAAATLAFLIVQSMQLLGLTAFPLDAVLIYATSLCIVVPFVLMMLALHYLTVPQKRFWTHAALIFTVIYAVFVTANYVVQLATVIPAQVAGEASVIRVLEQSPHSMFWNYDAVGYIAMGLAALLAIPAFDRVGSERWVRIALIAHVLTTPLIGIVYFYPVFSHALLMLAFPWGITAPAFMLLLALALRRRAERSD
ncbi:hypothetical protein [Wenzhouxiangella sp. EGI_FJ10305]|uniref:hypothetical protein n=1 Tax=Wenzhouxiangella sp. EGI_FJ10305 TaxID=3243768 RepID=UPI0035E1CC35